MATVDQITNYINIASMLVEAGAQIAGKLKGVFTTLFGQHGLTDEQINAIEAAGMADSEARRLRRVAMGAAD
jgi:hypothetical protein